MLATRVVWILDKNASSFPFPRRISAVACVHERGMCTLIFTVILGIQFTSLAYYFRDSFRKEIFGENEVSKEKQFTNSVILPP